MISRKLLSQVAVIVLLALSASTLVSQDTASSTEARLSKVEERLSSLDARTAATGGCGLSILFGAFCALWAQNTRRSGLLWFIFGAIFNVITVLVLLYKNWQDMTLARSPTPDGTRCPNCGRPRPAGALICDCGHYFGTER